MSMRRALRTIEGVVGGILGLVAVVLAFSAYRYSREMAIDESRGANESGYIRIGGIDQWIQIRGEDRRNPVLLLLNGGPGFSVIPATPLFRRWEHQFTVVMWDQRGEGRTLSKSGTQGQGSMTIERMAADGVEVAMYLRAHLHQDKVVVLGHSWGSILGVRMVKLRPDLFAAYVGTGQVTSFPADAVASYPLVRARAHSLGNRAAEIELTSAGPPPYERPEKNLAWIIWANALDPGQTQKLPLSTGLPWALVKVGIEQSNVGAGLKYSQERMLGPMLQTDLTTLGYKFEIPVVIIQGSEDLVTVTALAREYFDKISAPRKEFVLLPGEGHLALLKDRDMFRFRLLLVSVLFSSGLAQH